MTIPGLSGGHWRYRLYEITAACVIAMAVIYISTSLQKQYRANVAPGAWFRVNEIYVPDHRVGEDPEMIYDREIRENFQGFWIVEVQREEGSGGLWSLACQGSGVADYAVDDYIPENKVRLSWFVGRECDLKPGRYRMRTSWVMKRPDWPEKATVYLSNIFTVAN